MMQVTCIASVATYEPITWWKQPKASNGSNNENVNQNLQWFQRRICQQA